jgi:hypothetical protein
MEGQRDPNLGAFVANREEWDGLEGPSINLKYYG